MGKSIFALFFLTLIPFSLGSTHRHDKRAVDGLNAQTIARIKKTLAGNSTDSWVSGTRTQALLEYDYPHLAVYSPKFDEVFKHGAKTPPVEVNKIVSYWQARHNATDGQFITQGGSPADAFSIGNAFVLASVTAASEKKRKIYTKSVKQAIKFLWSSRYPRLADGTFSHRPVEEPVQLWDDFVSMLPPFLAYYGVYSKNATYLDQSYKQIKQYRHYLKPEGSELWMHIKLGSYEDTRIWATGVAWSANGMLRVSSTMANSQFKKQFAAETKQLNKWAFAIVSESFQNLYANTTVLPNVFFRQPEATFPESSSSALMAASAYRLAAIGHPGAGHLIPIADKMRKALYKKVRKNGWVSDVVNPVDWSQETATNESPESLAFMLMLEAAWRDYKHACSSKSVLLLDANIGL